MKPAAPAGAGALWGGTPMVAINSDVGEPNANVRHMLGVRLKGWGVADDREGPCLLPTIWPASPVMQI
jgi:hypothetical protein